MEDSFHRVFYAGWMVSEAYEIVRGEVRGNRGQLATDAEFDEGIAISQRQTHEQN